MQSFFVTISNKKKDLFMKLRKILCIATLCACVPFVSSCAYRADLNQGNYVDQDLVDNLSYGMSSEQVRYVLGAPMLVDPFDKSRWYYTAFKREGWNDPEIKNLVLLFQGNTLVDMSGDYKKPLSFSQTSPSLPTNNQVDNFELPEE